MVPAILTFVTLPILCIGFLVLDRLSTKSDPIMGFVFGFFIGITIYVISVTMP